MPYKGKAVQREEWLAVLDGRFLPIEELSLTIERDTTDVSMAGNMQPVDTITRAEMISGTIETRREPALKPRPGQLRLYGPDEEYLIWNLDVTGGIGIGLGEGYMVEFSATDWSCQKR